MISLAGCQGVEGVVAELLGLCSIQHHFNRPLPTTKKKSLQWELTRETSEVVNSLWIALDTLNSDFTNITTNKFG